MDVLEFIILLFSSGVVATVVSAIVTTLLQKKSEKESRIFNAKMEAYKNFIGCLRSYHELENIDDILKIRKISAPVILVCTAEIKEKVEKFDYALCGLYQSKRTVSEEKIRHVTDLGEVITTLMRDDLKVAKNNKKSFFSKFFMLIC